MEILIGQDVEYIVRDKKGIARTVEPFIPYSKENPHINEKGEQALVDCVLAETGIKPCTTAEQFIERTRSAENFLRTFLPEGYKLCADAYELYPDEELVTEMAQTFGCAPDMNCWVVQEGHECTIDPPEGEYANGRSAGGHIHVGLPVVDFLTSNATARFMELYLGVPSVLLDKNVDRARLYGTPGRYRIKDYGLEYRFLSNFWTRSDDLIRWAFEQSVRSAKKALMGEFLTDEEGLRITSAIANRDMDEINALIEEYDIVVPVVEKKLVEISIF